MDLEDLESGLEELRAEERITGCASRRSDLIINNCFLLFYWLCRRMLQKTADDELFVVDTVGDEKSASCIILLQGKDTTGAILVRKTVRFSTSALTSTKILSQRSAVPAVFSRSTSTNAADRERKNKMSRKEKEKLLRIAKRSRKGPFNTVIDPSEYKAGDGSVELSTAAKESGSYDPWGPTGLVESEAKEGPSLRNVKVPV